MNVMEQLNPKKDLLGVHVYLEPLDEKYREPLRELARDERIWEFTKTILLNDSYDQQWDLYFNQALRLRELGGLSFIIRAVTEGVVGGEEGSGIVTEGLAAGEEGPIIGMTRLY